MKIDKKKVIEINRALISSIVSDIRQGDDISLLATRVGDRVTVLPDDQQSEQITVTFHLGSAMAVSKGAELSNITSLLNLATNGEVLALGTNLGSSMAAGAGIAGATIRTLTDIMRTEISQGNQRLQIPIEEIDHPASGSIKISNSTTVTGWTVTSDWDNDEQANFSHIAKLLSANGARIKTKNVGQQAQIAIAGTASEAIAEVSSDSALAIADLDWNLKTDGAFTHDTISAVQIADVSIVLRYVP